MTSSTAFYDSQIKYGSSHTKAITTIDMEPGGGRFITGSQNGILALWDYGGMDSQFLPYRLLDPLSNGLALRVAALGKEAILVACGGESGGSGKMRLLQRSGSLECDCPCGDPYVMDQRVTRGHTQAITCGLFSFLNPNKFYTSGADGTVRIWDRSRCSSKNDQMLIVSKVVAHGSARSNNQGSVLSLNLWPNDDSILVGTRNGSVRLYSPQGPWNKPIFSIERAENGANCPISWVEIDHHNLNLFGARSGDSLLIYDKRNLIKPLHHFSELATEEEIGSNFEFMSGDRLLVGVHSRKPFKTEQGKTSSISEGTAFLLDLKSGDKSTLWKDDKKGVTRVKYSPKLDQIILGHSDGSLTGIYASKGESPIVQKGILKALKQPPPKRDAVIDASPQIINPEPLPYLTTLVGPQELEYLNNHQSEDNKLHPSSNYKPELPLQGEGRQGRISNNSNTQRILLQHTKVIGRDEDPRDALLRVAERAEKEPLFVTPAYQDTQPDPIFEDEDDHLYSTTSKKKQKTSN